MFSVVQRRVERGSHRSGREKIGVEASWGSEYSGAGPVMSFYPDDPGEVLGYGDLRLTYKPVERLDGTEEPSVVRADLHWAQSGHRQDKQYPLGKEPKVVYREGVNGNWNVLRFGQAAAIRISVDSPIQVASVRGGNFSNYEPSSFTLIGVVEASK